MHQGIKFEKFGMNLPIADRSPSSLVLDAQRGDRSAFLELVHGFEEIVLRVALNVTFDEAAAQQIYCSVFRAAFVSINKLDAGSSVFIWLYGILARQCLEYCWRHREATGADRSEGGSWPQAQKALYALTPTERVVFQLKQCQGLKIRTLAEIFDVTPEFIIGSLQRANCKLREQLSEQRGMPSPYERPCSA